MLTIRVIIMLNSNRGKRNAEQGYCSVLLHLKSFDQNIKYGERLRENMLTANMLVKNMSANLIC